MHAIITVVCVWLAWCALVAIIRECNRPGRERVERMVQRRYELAAQARLAPERYYWWD